MSSQEDSFSYPPRPTAGIIGRFGLGDILVWCVSLGLIYVGLKWAMVTSWVPLAVLGVPALILVGVPFIRFGGRGVVAWLRPVISTLVDRARGRGVFRGAVFAPSSLAYRMDLPGDLAGFRPLAVPGTDGRTRYGVMVHDKEKIATAALMTFGNDTGQTADSHDQIIRLNEWEGVMQSYCAEEAGVSRWQLMMRGAPDTVNQAARHVMKNGVVKNGDGVVWDVTQELITEHAPRGQRHEVFLVIAFDLSVLGGAIADAGGGDSGLQVVLLERMIELERGAVDAHIDVLGWLTPGQYAAVMRTQFDPDSLALHDLLAGDESEVDPRLAGPAASERSFRAYQHDSAYSQTIWVHELPKLPVRMNWIAPMLQLGNIRATCTLITQPLTTHDADKTVTKQRLNAESAMYVRKKQGLLAKSRTQKEGQAAIAQESAASDGDGIFRYHLLIAVTARDLPTLTRNVMTVRRKLIRMKCESMVLYGEQDQAFFAAALPLARGLSPMRGLLS